MCKLGGKPCYLYNGLGILCQQCMWDIPGGCTPLSSWTPRANKKNNFSKLHHQHGSKFYQLMLWVYIHGIYKIVKIIITKFDDLIYIEHTVSN